VLGQLSGEEETDGGLDLTRGDGGPLVMVSQTASLSSDTLKDVVEKGVNYGHGFGGHSGVGVNLLQDLVDVDSVRLLPLLLALFLVSSNGLGSLAGLLGSLS